MIKSALILPDILSDDPQSVKLSSVFELYKSEALFFTDENENFILSLLDGSAVLCGEVKKSEELLSFLKAAGAKSVFLSAKNAEKAGFKDKKTVKVFKKARDKDYDLKSDRLSSKEVYTMLKSGGFSLPPYEYFAPDYCRRINHKKAALFAKSGECAAVGFLYKDICLINGIVSFKKGGGRKAIDGLFCESKAETMLACAEEKNSGFYEKCGFKAAGFCAYCNI